MTKQLFTQHSPHHNTLWQRLSGMQKTLAFLVGMVILMPVLTVQAVGMTQPSASESSELATTQAGSVEGASPSASTTLLKKRLEKILGDHDATASVNTIAGYVGEVTRVSEEALAVKTPKANQIIPIDENVTILKRDKVLPISDISVGNWVIVIGKKVRNGDVSPTKILVQTASLQPTEHMVSIGSINSVGKSSIEFIPRGQTEPLTLNVGKNSKLIDSAGESLTIKQLPTQVSAIAVALQGDNNTWTISTLKTLVGMDEFKNSTPSPTPKPSTSPKASPKPSATPSPTPAP